VTGGTGFIGRRLVRLLLEHGFTNIRCLTRFGADSSIESDLLKYASERNAKLCFHRGNLLSPEDCSQAVKDVELIYHLAAARGEKSIPDAFMHSVVTTRNLLEAVKEIRVRRFVNVSSFSVYAGNNGVLDESTPVETHPELRFDAYTFAKVKQDAIVGEYASSSGIPCVIVRPGFVYGPGNEGITGRVGIGTFGVFLHLGGGNTIPLTYVDNCARALMLAGIVPGVDGEVFNIVDDDLPSSREFLRMYKRNVRRFKSVYIPRPVSYALCLAWEKYSAWSQGQLPPTFNRKSWAAYWKKARYTNAKVKKLLGWKPYISTAEGLRLYFQSCKNRNAKA
jgi:nucleoside-diphosphate-sugar epimerase